MSEVLNLNAVARPDLRVKLNDTEGKERTWRIPPPDSETVANLMAVFEELNAEAEKGNGERVTELFAEARERMEELFAERHAEQEMERLPRLGDEQLGAMFGFIVRSYQEAIDALADEAEEPGQDDDAARPTKPTAARSRRSSKTSRARSTRARSKAGSSTS